MSRSNPRAHQAPEAGARDVLPAGRKPAGRLSWSSALAGLVGGAYLLGLVCAASPAAAEVVSLGASGLVGAMSGLFSSDKNNKGKGKGVGKTGRRGSDPLAPLSAHLPADGEWSLVPGTAFEDFRLADEVAQGMGIQGTLGSRAVLGYFNGAGYDPTSHSLYLWGGGDVVYGGNEIYRLSLETLEITTLTLPSELDDVIHDADGVPCPVPTAAPSAGPTYDGIVWSPVTNSLFIYPAGNFCSDTRIDTAPLWEFDPASGDWQALTARGEIPAPVMSVLDPVTGSIAVISSGSPASLRMLDPTSGSHSVAIDLGMALAPGNAIYDSTRDKVILVTGDGIFSLSLADPGTPAKLADLPAAMDGFAGAAYHEASDKLVLWGGGSGLAVLDMVSMTWLELNPATGPSPQGEGVFSKWFYVPELDAFAAYNNVDEGLWLYKLPSQAPETPTPGNQPPVADAGPNQTTDVGNATTFDGIGSNDPDGDPLSYRWEVVSRPSGSTAQPASPDAMATGFTPDVAGSYSLRLTVSDGSLEHSDSTTLLTNGVNGAPSADAGPDRSVQVGQSASLDGRGSSDPDGDPLSYAWHLVAKPSGSTAAIAQASSAVASLVPDVAGSYTVELVVNDGTSDSAADSMTVTAAAVPTPTSCDPVSNPDACGPSTLVDSGPVTSSSNGQVIEGLRIVVGSGPAIRVNGHSNVIIRNVEILHGSGKGIDITNAPNVLIENVNVVHTGAPSSGPNPDAGRLNIHCYNSPDMTLRRARLTRGSSGIYLQGCHRAHMSSIEGHDFRGPFPRGQLIQWNGSHDGVLEDFSVISPLATSWPEDNINAYASNNVVIRRGLIDGNNAPSGVGIVIEHGSISTASGALVEDVDAVRMGNGAYGLNRAYNVVLRRTRAKDNHCEGVGGRDAPRSGAQHWIVWPGEDWNVQILDSQYANPCSYGHIIWDGSAANVLQLREENFTPRAPIVHNFAWE